jgi:hypothetical protein
MSDRSNEEIEATRKAAIEFIERNGLIVVNNISTEYHYDNIDRTPSQKKMHMLSKEIDIMSECSILYCCDGWQDNKGCRIEHEIAREYNMVIIYENPSVSFITNSLASERLREEDLNFDKRLENIEEIVKIIQKFIFSPIANPIVEKEIIKEVVINND